MKYDFTSLMNRSGHDSIAVDQIPIPGAEVKEGFSRIPMWVADMNFATVPTVQEYIIKRAQHPMFGYFNPRPEYFDRIIEGVTTILINSKYQVYRYYIDEVHEQYRKKQPLCDKKLDGLILFGSIDDDGLVKWLQRQSKYISSIYGDIIENADFVGSDLASTINLMIDYIAKLGYDEIGVVSGDKHRVPALYEYAAGKGLRLCEGYSFNAGNDMSRAYEMMKERLETGARPPKVMCCMNDEMALGVMNAVLDAGLRVPEDVSVTGHDDILKSNYSRVPLTTVRIYKEEIGRLVTDLLLERINYLCRKMWASTAAA